MPERDFTLILTKGTHAISSAAAATILGALERREPVVEVEVDMFGAGDAPRTVTLATAHVIALSRNPASLPADRIRALEAVAANVTVLRPRAASS